MKTIEGAILLPIYLFIIVVAIDIGIAFYQEIREQKEEALVEDLWEVKDFYMYKGVEQFLDD